MTNPSLTIRPAAQQDWPAINDLRNHYIRTSTAIYTDQEDDLAALAARFERRDFARHPVTVAEVSGRFVGFGMLSEFDTKCGYAGTVEDCVYVVPNLHGQGIGQVLLADLLDRAKAAGLHNIVARIDTGQPASLALHGRFGFESVGTLRQAGFKFGQWRDVVYLQKLLVGG